MDEPTPDPAIRQLAKAIESLSRDLREDVRGARAEILDVRAEVRSVGTRVDGLDTRINGRIGRLEDEHREQGVAIAHVQEQVGREMHVAARAQGAAEEREHLGVPASPLPPPVTSTGSQDDETGSKWARNFAIVAGGFSALAGALSVILGGAH